MKTKLIAAICLIFSPLLSSCVPTSILNSHDSIDQKRPRYRIREQIEQFFTILKNDMTDNNKRSPNTIDSEPLTGENLERYLLQQEKGTDNKELARGAGYSVTDEGLAAFIEAVYIANYVRGFADSRQISFQEGWKIYQASVNARPTEPNPEAEKLVIKLRDSVKARLARVAEDHSKQFSSYNFSPTVSIEDSNSINISWRGSGFYTVDSNGSVKVVRGGIEPLNFDDNYQLPWSINSNEGMSMLTDLVMKNILNYLEVK